MFWFFSINDVTWRRSHTYFVLCFAALYQCRCEKNNSVIWNNNNAYKLLCPSVRNALGNRRTWKLNKLLTWFFAINCIYTKFYEVLPMRRKWRQNVNFNRLCIKAKFRHRNVFLTVNSTLTPTSSHIYEKVSISPLDLRFLQKYYGFIDLERRPLPPRICFLC